MSASGSKRAIVAALLANAGIAVAKFVGFVITGSSSMLAESVHSLADTSNQGLLLWGQRQASKEPDELHQFGYGRSRYFYSFVVALVLFTLGAAFALYEGYEKVVQSARVDLTAGGSGHPGGRNLPGGLQLSDGNGGVEAVEGFPAGGGDSFGRHAIQSSRSSCWRTRVL